MALELDRALPANAALLADGTWAAREA